MIGTKEVMHGCCTTTGLGSHALTQNSQNRQILYWVTKHGDRSQIMEQISQRQGFIEMCRDSNEQPLKFLMSLMKTDIMNLTLEKSFLVHGSQNWPAFGGPVSVCTARMIT